MKLQSSAVISLRIVRDRTVRYAVENVSNAGQAKAIARAILGDSPRLPHQPGEDDVIVETWL